MVKANLLKANKQRDYDKKDKGVPEEVRLIKNPQQRNSQRYFQQWKCKG